MNTTLSSQSTLSPSGELFELWYYYAAGGHFPVQEWVASIAEAERVLEGKKYFSAELFRPGSPEVVKSWERSVA